MARPRPDEQSIVREYARLAARYDCRWARYVAGTQRELLRHIEPLLAPRSRVLDLGCGTGSLLIQLCQRQAENLELVGLDLSPEMLSMARAKLPERVELLEGNAENIPLADRSFDLVVSCSVYHFWRHPEIVLGEIRRVLRPGGSVVIADWCDDYLVCKLCNIWLRLVNPAHFRTVGSQECRRALQAAGFQNERIDRYKVTWLWGMMTAIGNNPTDSEVCLRTTEK